MARLDTIVTVSPALKKITMRGASKIKNMLENMHEHITQHITRKIEKSFLYINGNIGENAD